jgi:RNA polymerase sigma-70 factor (ECF subfamily)
LRGRPGRFQLEAAIQSAHTARLTRGDVNRELIVGLYDLLIEVSPTIGARLGRIAALAESRGPSAAWAEIDTLPGGSVVSHQPYWALRGELAQRLGDAADARRALRLAAGLTSDPCVRRFLEQRLAAL